MLSVSFYFKAPDKLPFDKYRSTINATTIKGATDTNAAADRLHHGVIDEFSETIATGRSCTSVNVKMNAKKKSVHPKIMQNSPATTIPGMEFGNTTFMKA